MKVRAESNDSEMEELLGVQKSSLDLIQPK